jgi:hypothetical protein
MSLSKQMPVLFPGYNVLFKFINVSRIPLSTDFKDFLARSIISSLATWKKVAIQIIHIATLKHAGRFFQYLFLLANATNESITGTSTSTPTTVTSAAGDCNPNRAMATATASSKKLLAPIMAAGAQTA